MTRVLEAVEKNAASTQVMNNTLVRFTDSICAFTKAMEKTQENFVKEYSNFRRDMRELVSYYEYTFLYCLASYKNGVPLIVIFGARSYPHCCHSERGGTAFLWPQCSNTRRGNQ